MLATIFRSLYAQNTNVSLFSLSGQASETRHVVGDHGAAFAGQVHPVAVLACALARSLATIYLLVTQDGQYSCIDLEPAVCGWRRSSVWLVVSEHWKGGGKPAVQPYGIGSKFGQPRPHLKDTAGWKILKHCLRDRLLNAPRRQLLSQG
jgi:hypothetical protein